MNTIEIYRAVREVLAHHLSCRPSVIRASSLLDQDLALTPLELVLVALELEERAGVHLHLDELTEVATVGDLTAYLSRAIRQEQILLAAGA